MPPSRGFILSHARESKQHLWVIALNREQPWLWHSPSLCMLHPQNSAFAPHMQNWSSMQSQQLLPELAVLEEANLHFGEEVAVVLWNVTK